ncbi:hypothetical protein RQP46_010946 [Phenoliferia psychrophenolica]
METKKEATLKTPAPAPRARRGWTRCLAITLLIPALSVFALLLYGHHKASNPHSHLLATPSSADVVKPLFSPGTRFKVEASVWLNAFDPEWQHMREPEEIARFATEEMVWGEGMQTWADWKVTLPSSAVIALTNVTEDVQSSLFAYISVVPSAPLAEHPSTSFKSFTSGTLPQFSRSYWPVNPVYNYFSPPNTPLDKLLDQSGLKVELLWRPEPEMVEDPEEAKRDKRLDGMFGESMRPLPKMVEKEIPVEERVPPKLRTRAWVATPVGSPEPPVYDLVKFKNQMTQLLIVENNCNDRKAANLPHDHLPCTRKFSFRAHAENLLGLGEGDWRYGPYLATDLARDGPLDLVELPTGGEEFTFDLRFSFGATSLARLALAESEFVQFFARDFLGGADVDDDPAAADWNSDVTEATNGVLGLTSSGNARPLLRLSLAILGSTLRLLSTFLTLIYFFQLHSTFGLSTLSLPLFLVAKLLQLTVEVGSEEDLGEGATAAFFLVVDTGIVAWRLWGGQAVWNGWIPTLSKRVESKEERRSAREDSKFGLDKRIALVATIFALTALPMPTWLKPFFYTSLPTTSSPTLFETLSAYLPCFYVAATLTMLISQYLLNRRLGVFGGDSRIAVLMTVAALGCDLVQVAMRPWWGKWKTGDSWIGWMAVEGIGKVLLAGQALTLRNP